MEDVMVIIRYNDGAIGLTGWGFFYIWVFITLVVGNAVSRAVR